MGLGYWLTEKIVYDPESGQTLTHNTWVRNCFIIWDHYHTFHICYNNHGLTLINGLITCISINCYMNSF